MSFLFLPRYGNCGNVRNHTLVQTVPNLNNKNKKKRNVDIRNQPSNVVCTKLKTDDVKVKVVEWVPCSPTSKHMLHQHFLRGVDPVDRSPPRQTLVS